MEDTRKGFLTEEQEKQLDELFELKGIYETFDGTAIKLSDNMVLEKSKAKLPPETLPVVYDVIDEVFKSLISIAE